MAHTEKMLVLTDELRAFCLSHSEDLVRRAPEMIKACLEFDAIVPHKYGWRCTSEKALSGIMHSALGAKEVNDIYWRDQARNAEAYSTTCFWRGVELMKSAIRELNSREVVAAAVLSRSLLELACAYIVNANMIRDLGSQISFPPGVVVGSQEFENAVVKMLWGTRFGDPHEHLKQTNVLTFIKKVDKAPGGEGVQKVYDYLCDVAHPSFVGNTRFWSHIERTEPDGSEIRLLERRSDGDGTSAITSATLYAVSLSAFSLERSFGLIHEGLKQLFGKLKSQANA
jgi:hypothetical protein